MNKELAAQFSAQNMCSLSGSYYYCQEVEPSQQPVAPDGNKIDIGYQRPMSSFIFRLETIKCTKWQQGRACLAVYFVKMFKRFY